MAHSNSAYVMIVYALCAFMSVAAGEVIQADGQPKHGGAEPVRIPINLEDALGFMGPQPLKVREEDMARWSRGRAYEKLMVADWLLPRLTSPERIGRGGPEWTRGGNDLSLVACRAKWGLECILGMPLPNVRSDPSPEELEALHAEAARLVEAYRSGIMALAADQAVSPEDFAGLKRKYRAKFVRRTRGGDFFDIQGMEDLLGEWPPIGRKMEDFVSIIGAKGVSSESIAKGSVLYSFYRWAHGAEYYFIVRDGIIRSVWRSPR